MSMDSNGKIIFAKHSEIQQANLKNLSGGFTSLIVSMLKCSLVIGSACAYLLRHVGIQLQLSNLNSL